MFTRRPGAAAPMPGRAAISPVEPDADDVMRRKPAVRVKPKAKTRKAPGLADRLLASRGAAPPMGPPGPGNFGAY